MPTGLARNSPRPCDSRDCQQRQTTHRKERQQLQVVRRSRPAQGHISRQQDCLLRIRRIVMRQDRRALGMLVNPLLQFLELLRGAL